MSKEKFVPVNGAYNITSAQKDEFTQFLRNKIKENNKGEKINCRCECYQPSQRYLWQW